MRHLCATTGVPYVVSSLLNRTIDTLPRAALAALICFSVACPSTKPPCAAGEDQICANCKTNFDTAAADLKYCAAQGQMCDELKRDLGQLAALNPANEPHTQAALAHVDGCKGKTDADTECAGVRAALAQVSCE